MIPKELKKLPQWCCSSTTSKMPLNPKTGKAAAVDNPATWGTYEEAISSGKPFIGFVLTENDPFTIIDLDDPENEEQQKRHSNILATLDSYTELSKSGNGAHIIVRGNIPKGVRRDNIEVYSSLRYMICTGKVIKHKPIAERQELLDVLYKEMDTTQEIELQATNSVFEDLDVLNIATGASNAAKFNMLCRGEWQGEYPSQSEADFALLSIFAYYTPANEQVRRLFRMSALGKRDKAMRNDVYIDRALRKIRAKQPPTVDITALTKKMVTKEVPAPPKPTIEYPPGLIGEMARYFYASAIRPVHEIGIAAAIGLLAGVTGRAYNISGTGLNQYIILLAKTGSGKEGLASGIDALMSAVREQVPVVDQFIGPGVFASGQALLRTFDEKPCFISVLGEIGLTLQQICDPRANSAHVMLRRVLLDLYTKSGWDKTLRPMVYSDKDKNTNAVQAPSLTVLGESTPETFFDNIDQSHISEGLIPRFSIIEYKGQRPAKNPNAFMRPPEALVKKFTDVILTALSVQQNNACCHIKVDAQATVLLDAFDVHADKEINGAARDIDMQLWNRAHLKALKLAALLAVGHNLHDPVVTKEMAEWAINFINADIDTMLLRFKEQSIGTGDHRLESEVKHAVEEYLKMSKKTRKSYYVQKEILDKGIIPYGYLRRRLRQLSAFRNDRRGATAALKACLDDMVAAEVLDKISEEQARTELKIKSALFVKGRSWR